jgi:hypothetical protein
VRIDPPYSVEYALQPSFDGVGFETYELRFAPTYADAIRIRGTPGGSQQFVSGGEIRVRAISANGPPDPQVDVTAQGEIVARVFELEPPVPVGSGNTDPETIRNGTFPPVGSSSAHAQYDTSHGGDQLDDDWIGYTFQHPHLFSRIVFQEGLHSPAGGRFDALGIEVLPVAEGSWVPVDDVVSTPEYPAAAGAGYVVYTLSFPPVSGVGIRLRGDPGGSGNFVSVAELRVFELVPPEPAGTPSPTATPPHSPTATASPTTAPAATWTASATPSPPATPRDATLTPTPTAPDPPTDAVTPAGSATPVAGGTGTSTATPTATSTAAPAPSRTSGPVSPGTTPVPSPTATPTRTPLAGIGPAVAVRHDALGWIVFTGLLLASIRRRTGRRDPRSRPTSA